jgi:dynein heavy chain
MIVYLVHDNDYAQGTLMATPASCPAKDGLLRLWVHESCRVFHDR